LASTLCCFRFYSSALILFVACLLGLLSSGTGAAQSADRTKAPSRFTQRIDVSAGAFSQLTGTRIPTSPLGAFVDQMTQGTSTSAGVFGTLHQPLNRWFGYNVNFGYTRFSENYSAGSGYLTLPGSPSIAPSSFTEGSIRTHEYELTIASVIAGPRTRRFDTFAQFGGGGLFFLPIHGAGGATDQTRPAMVFGAGMNCQLANHLQLRVEYRGLFYKSPDFNLPPYDGANFPMSRLFTVTNTPAVSLVYRFGKPASKPSKKEFASLP